MSADFNNSTQKLSQLFTASTTQTALTLPACSEGDLIQIVIMQDRTSNGLNLPVGGVGAYTALFAANNYNMYYKRAGASEPNPTITSTGSTFECRAIITCVTGADETNPINASAEGTASGGSNWTTQELTTTVDNCIKFSGGGTDSGVSDWAAGDEPSNITLIDQGAGTSMWLGLGFRTLGAAGATGTETPWENQVGSKKRFTWAVAPATAAVTIDDTDTDTRVTEARTVRITTPSTLATDANTTIKIDDAGNDAIVPDSVNVVSGLTVDVVFTVPDAYAGLPYDNTGYVIIVSTADGDATSAAVPYLPATGNGDVILTDVSNTDIESSPALEVDDQIEWTNSSVITIDSEGKVTSTEESATFEFRVWDHNDSTWGDWASVEFGDVVDTAPTMPADTSVNVAENTTAVGTFAATAGTAPITYTLSGADSALFGINSSTGAVVFLSAPDYEAGSNTKAITVTATNAIDSASQNIIVNVTNVVEAPVMPADATRTVVEGSTSVISTGATFVDGVVTYTKGGADQALFNINSSSGALSFAAPATIGTYTVSRTATNSAGSDAQVLTVNVVEQNTDINVTFGPIAIYGMVKYGTIEG